MAKAKAEGTAAGTTATPATDEQLGQAQGATDQSGDDVKPKVEAEAAAGAGEEQADGAAVDVETADKVVAEQHETFHDAIHGQIKKAHQERRHDHEAALQHTHLAAGELKRTLPTSIAAAHAGGHDKLAGYLQLLHDTI